MTGEGDALRTAGKDEPDIAKMLISICGSTPTRLL